MDPSANPRPTGQPKPPRKMDQKLVSEQPHEAQYIALKYQIPIRVVRSVLKETQSRRKVYAILRQKGYVINTKR